MFNVLFQTYFFKLCSQSMWNTIENFFVISNIDRVKNSEVTYLIKILKKYVLDGVSIPFYVGKDI